MRFQDAAKDARTIVYAGIQADPLVGRMAGLLLDASVSERWLARAVMNGERTDPDVWRRMFPSLLVAGDEGSRAHAEEILAVAIQVAEKGEASRSQFRGAVVEELTARLLAQAATGAVAPVRRERRVLFDGVPAEIHPYDVTVESDERPRVFDCKWGARGINADVLNQLDDARRHAADEDVGLAVSLVVFDAARSCLIRLERQTAAHDATGLISLETLDDLGESHE